MAWFMSKLSIVFPIEMERLYQPMKGNWVSRFSFINEDEAFQLQVGNGITIQNDDIGLLYVGIIRELVNSYNNIYIVATGRNMNKRAVIPMQSLQQQVTKLIELISSLPDAEMAEVTSELATNGISASLLNWAADQYNSNLGLYNTEEYGITSTDAQIQATNEKLNNSIKTMSWISNIGQSQLQQLEKLNITITQDGNGTFIIGSSPLSFDIETHKLEAISIGNNYIELPLKKFDKIYNNITAVEYTSDSTLIWL
jgi:hypothetical protein